MRSCLLLVLLLANVSVLGQTRKKSARPEPLYGGYKDLVVLDSTIWALDVFGVLKSFTSRAEERAVKFGIKEPITSIHRAPSGCLVAVSGLLVYLLNTGSGTATQVGRLPAKTTFLTLDAQQQVWAATETGLLNVATNKRFVPDSSLNHYYKWLPEPSAVLLDAGNVLWLGFDKGEWGGNLHVFDLTRQTFLPVFFRDTLACLGSINTFCQVGAQVYLSGKYGCITRFENFQAKHVFNSSEEENYRTERFGITEGERIWTIAYSPAEQACYYYSQNGIFRAGIKGDLSKARAWQLVRAPDVPCTTTQPIRGCKMAFTSNNKLVVLVKNYAIGIWDGQVYHLIP